MSSLHRPSLAATGNPQTIVSMCGLGAAALAYLVIPGAIARASVGVVSASIAPYWAAAILVGSIVAFVGLVSHRPRIEVIGLGLIGGGMMLAAAAILEVRDLASSPGAIVYATAGATAIARTLALVHQQHARDRVVEMLRDEEL